MAIIRHQKQKLSAGLSWNQLTQKNYKAESINLSEHEGRPYGSIYLAPGDDGTNAYVGLTQAKGEVGNLSAAAIFASLCKDGMIIDSVSDKSAWWCASINHQMLTQTDRIFDKDDLGSEDNGIIEFIDEALPQIIDSPEVKFKIYASADLAEFIQDLIGDAPVEVISMGLSDLIFDSGKKFPSSFNKYRVKKITGTSPLLILAMALLLLGSTYYFFLYEPAPRSVSMDMSGLQAMKANRESAAKVVKKTPPAEKDKQILSSALEEEKAWLVQDLNKNSLKNVASEVLKAYKITPLYAAGWTLNEVTYDRSIEESKLIVKWYKDFGTPGDFRHYWSQVGVEYDINLDGKTATVYLPLSYEEAISGDPEDVYQELKQSEFDRIALMSSLDKYGFNWSMNIKPKLARRQIVEGLYNKDLADAKQLGIDRTGFEITGKDSSAGFHNAVNVASESPLVLAEEVTINVTNGFDWIIKGELYNVK